MCFSIASFNEHRSIGHKTPPLPANVKCKIWTRDIEVNTEKLDIFQTIGPAVQYSIDKSNSDVLRAKHISKLLVKGN